MPNNLDKQIEEAITLPSGNHIGAHSKYVYSPDVAMAVKALIKSTLSTVRPEEREPDGLAGGYQYIGWNSALAEYDKNCADLLE